MPSSFLSNPLSCGEREQQRFSAHALERIALGCTADSQDTGCPPQPALTKVGAGMTLKQSFSRKRESRSHTYNCKPHSG
jgi:hypothetical protein